MPTNPLTARHHLILRGVTTELRNRRAIAIRALARGTLSERQADALNDLVRWKYVQQQGTLFALTEQGLEAQADAPQPTSRG